MSRFYISNTSDWELADPSQDVRGFAALDGTGAAIGRVTAMIADTDAEIISAVVLDTGAEVPTFDLTIGDGVVYLAGSVPGAATATAPDDYAHPGIAPRTVVVSAEPDAQHAAVPRAPRRRGAHAGLRRARRCLPLRLRRRSRRSVPEPALRRRRGSPARRGYPDERDFDAEREAVRYGYQLAQHGAA